MSGAGSLGRGRTLASPAFADDDGAADPAVRALIAAAGRGELAFVDLAVRLREARLLAAVVAVLDEATDAGEEKDSHMAVVSMVNAAGERGLLAFTGLDALQAWDADARPVPARGADIGAAALADGARAVVLDVAGPVALAVTGTALEALAR